MTEQEQEAPFGIFRALYTVGAWGTVVLLVAILGWLMYVLFDLAPVGTTQSGRLAVARPTMTALAGLVPTAPPEEVTELPQQCVACHMVDGTGGAVGPDLSDIASVAAERIEAPDYAGDATTAREYIRESIDEPSAYIVEGFENAANPDTSIMPAYGGLPILATDEVYFGLLLDYLMTLE